MKKLITAFAVLISFSLSAQTIFHYGNDSVSINEFLRAYNKNKTGTQTEKAFREYLDLYIASRLKIKEARERGYDTLPQMVTDLDNLRQQILPNYLNDKETVNKLVDEAYNRSQKNIHLAHIFISFQQDGITDTLSALKKLAEVHTKLKNGTSFTAVAKELSDDPSAKQNSGDLGWITVFNLPYELENLAYATPSGKVSPAHRSKAGYHIFKNLGERKDPGRVRASQILIAFPPQADALTKAAGKQLADSIYNRLLKGDDFGKLASLFSNDMHSSVSNGQMQEFGVGDYEPSFENAVFSLQANNISKPFVTAHGYHIVKLTSKTQPIKKTDARAMEILRGKVEQSDRMVATKMVLAQKILKEAGFKKALFNEADLWLYSDSLLNYQKMSRPVSINASSTLFQFGGKNINAADWIGYSQTFRYKPDGSGIKPYPVLWEEFVQATALNYYQENLEKYSEEFREQISEFKEGNLFFEIMQREVWGPAQSDSAALANYFEKNREKYTWKQSADAVIFYSNDMAVAKTFLGELRRSPNQWQDLASKYEEIISTDSSRFELDQIPNSTKKALTAGTITEPVVNKADNTVAFAYVIRNHNRPELRSFDDARGLVITDYQAALEKEWVEQLKRKYPVRINDKALRTLIKEKKY